MFLAAGAALGPALMSCACVHGLGPALAVQGLLPAGAAFAAGNFDGAVAVPAVAGAEYELARAGACQAVKTTSELEL